MQFFATLFDLLSVVAIALAAPCDDCDNPLSVEDIVPDIGLASDDDCPLTDVDPTDFDQTNGAPANGTGTDDCQIPTGDNLITAVIKLVPVGVLNAVGGIF